jgi:hypothetical protein
MNMHDRCQNRARQHRLYTLSAQRWQDVSLLLPDVLEAEEHAQIVRGISSRRGDALLDALLASLDLGLVDSAEWASVYWVLWRVAEDRQSRGGGRPSWRTSWARAWAHVGRGLHFVSFRVRLCVRPCLTDLLAPGVFRKVNLQGQDKSARKGSIQSPILAIPAKSFAGRESIRLSYILLRRLCPFT